MPGLSNIPEPTTAYRPEPDAPGGHTVPLSTAASQEQAVRGPAIAQHAQEQDEPQEQIDSVSFLLLLLIAGGLLRAVLGFFGPMQGLDPLLLHSFAQRGKAVAAGEAPDAYPVFDLFAAGVSAVALPGWVAVIVGALLTLSAVPAAYLVGHAVTGRRVAGLMGAAVVALHPAVLTASNTLSASAIALALTTIGLAMLTYVPKRGQAYAVGGGIVLALAGLAAPLCWVVAAAAGVWVGWSARVRGGGQAFNAALLVLLVGVGPVFAYRATLLGYDKEALIPEFVSASASAQTMSPLQRTMITMTDPSLSELGEAMRLPLSNAGKLTGYLSGAQATEGKRDIVADILADAWLLMNAGLACLGLVSAGVMLLRRRLFEVVLMAGPFIAASLSTAVPGEALRLPMMAMVGVMSLGLLSKGAARVVDEAKLAEKAAKKAAKLAEREEKERARQERDLSKYKGDIYAFDKPSRRERKQRQQQQRKIEQLNAALPTGIVTQRVTQDPTAPAARPI